MPLQTGARLGPYEILGPIGAGGMGEVYRARDTRLDRRVAIKVLSGQLPDAPELRQRFEREARAVSSLSHPHICALYDVGQQDGVEFLVMEYLEGESLAARLEKGPLPLEELLRYATQIAGALDKAHRQGLVHRDLKPGNVMLTKSGAKLLDFGLAKAAGLASGAQDLSQSPTLSRPLTSAGSIVGTFQYMAPEQLEGKEADARSDIFAFGAMLYEMATGKKAFEASSQASLIAAIMTKEPQPISAVQPLAPAALDRVVRRCLAKDPDDRWQTAHDLMAELQWLAEGGSSAAQPALQIKRARFAFLPWAVAGICLIVAIVLAIAYFRPVPQPNVVRFAIPAPEKATLGTSFAISPDGRKLVFVANLEGKEALWLRNLDSLEAQPLPSTDGASFPFWSPDSRSVGFFAGGKLKKVEAPGGAGQILCDAPDGRGGAWNRDGVILFSPTPTSPLLRVSASGGVPVAATALDEKRRESSHRWPAFLPDGRHFVLLARSSLPGNEGLQTGSLDSQQTTPLLPVASMAAYAPPGYLLYQREGTLVAHPFDAVRLRFTGDPVTLAENVARIGEEGPTYYVAFSVAEDGTLSFRSGSASSRTELVWFDRAGKRLQPAGNAAEGYYDEPALSPDGKHLVTDFHDTHTATNDLWTVDLARGTYSRFTFHPADEAAAVWSPDGSRLAYCANPEGPHDLYVKTLAGVETPLYKSNSEKYVDDWSRDGKFLLYEDNNPKTGVDLWILPLTGDTKPQPFLITPFDEAHAAFSPDGRWIAYASDESGKSEIYVRPFPGPGPAIQISTSGGDQPAWRRDGRELFYVAPDLKLMVVPVKLGATLEPSLPQALFDLKTHPSLITGSRNTYLPSPDGQRILVDTLLAEGVRAPITVLLHWPATLRK